MEKRRGNRARKSGNLRKHGSHPAPHAQKTPRVKGAGFSRGLHGRILIHSFAKINFSIDVGAPEENGYHPVDMIMQQLHFHDNVVVEYDPDHRVPQGKHEIVLKSNRPYLPTDRRNLAYHAAEMMSERYGGALPGGTISITLHKMIPVAAGMAGGSGNAAAVIHALNVLWRCRLSLQEIMGLCAELGSDVPFCAMGQAKLNRCLSRKVKSDPMACTCARARGTGTELIPVEGIEVPVLIAKPHHGVSTAEVYQGLDSCTITSRPDNDRLGQRLNAGIQSPSDLDALFEDFINVLECYTLSAYPDVKELKDKMASMDTRMTLMSGSGPTVFSIVDSLKTARALCQKLRRSGVEAYWTSTIKEWD